MDDISLEIASSFHDIETIESKLEEYVDINHPIVQDLISADYSEERSILAVRKFRTLDAAMAFLDHGEGEHSGESPSRSDDLQGDDQMHK